MKIIGLLDYTSDKCVVHIQLGLFEKKTFPKLLHRNRFLFRCNEYCLVNNVYICIWVTGMLRCHTSFSNCISSKFKELLPPYSIHHSSAIFFSDQKLRNYLESKILEYVFIFNGPNSIIGMSLIWKLTFKMKSFITEQVFFSFLFKMYLYVFTLIKALTHTQTINKSLPLVFFVYVWQKHW